METKQHKPYPAPSVTGLILAIAQTINSFRTGDLKTAVCYACNKERQKEEFQVINKKFGENL